ncbi:MAG: 5'-methylthioadenosine/S-adenosylhomocysteine nucleosidase family protein [Alphaproteobacteria bacterium]
MTNLKNKKILLIKALKDESRHHFKDANIDVLYSGVGKVNAAYVLTKSITENRPDFVVNLGTAGSTHFNAGTLINCTKFIQRDMDATEFGYKKWETPAEKTPAILPYGERIDSLPEGICGTGDSFDTSGKKETYTVVEMEAYALAKICQRENIPFYCVKYISDGADGAAADDWEKSLDDGAKKLFDLYTSLTE